MLYLPCFIFFLLNASSFVLFSYLLLSATCWIGEQLQYRLMSVSYNLVLVPQYSSTVPISLFGIQLKMVNNHAKRCLLWWCSDVCIAVLNTHHQNHLMGHQKSFCCHLCYYSNINDFQLETKMTLLWPFYWNINTENGHLQPLIFLFSTL